MKTILIVEDELLLLEIMAVKLQREGYQTLKATNGILGFDLAIQKHPNLILLDIIMPEMDGLTMLKKLRQDDWGKKVPVILLTNVSDWMKAAQAFESDVNDYLVKSNWKLSDIVKKVRQHLQEDNKQGVI